MNKKWGTPDDERDISEFEARDLMCEIGRRLWAMQMADANSGNLSYRLGPDRVLATPTWIAKGFMEPDDLVVLDLKGNQVSGKRKKTSEVLLHLEVYRNREDVQAVVHAHPRHALAFAITKTPVPKCVLAEMELFVGEVPMTEYNTPGSQDFADSLKPYVRDFTTFLLAQHGALTVGRGLIEACWRMEILEGFCAMIIAANQLGAVERVSDEQLAAILRVKKGWGQPDRRYGDAEAAKCSTPPPGVGRANAPPAANPGGPAGRNESPAQGIQPTLVESVVRKVLQRLETP